MPVNLADEENDDNLEVGLMRKRFGWGVKKCLMGCCFEDQSFPDVFWCAWRQTAGEWELCG